METSRAISEKKIVKVDNLMEIDYGDVEGKDFSYLSKNYTSVVNAWSNRKDVKFPNGESYSDLIKRLGRFTDVLKKEKFDTRAAVTHNVVMRVLIVGILNIPQHLWVKLRIGHVKPYKILIPENSELYIDLNDK